MNPALVFLSVMVCITVLMAKIRGVRLGWLAGAAASTHTYANVLRDILPDQAFQVVGATIVKTTGTGLVEIQFLKNVPSPAGPGIETEIMQHGKLAEFYLMGDAQNTVVWHPPQPIDFDKDDSLNVFFNCGATLAGEVILLYLPR